MYIKYHGLDNLFTFFCKMVNLSTVPLNGFFLAVTLMSLDCKMTKLRVMLIFLNQYSTFVISPVIQKRNETSFLYIFSVCYFGHREFNQSTLIHSR